MSKQPDVLFRVTKTRWHRGRDTHTHEYTDWHIDRQTTDYRTRYSDVKCAQSYAEKHNEYNTRYPDRAYTKYTVEVELTVMPKFDKLSEDDPQRQVDDLTLQAQYLRQFPFVPFYVSQGEQYQGA